MDNTNGSPPTYCPYISTSEEGTSDIMASEYQINQVKSGFCKDKSGEKTHSYATKIPLNMNFSPCSSY